MLNVCEQEPLGVAVVEAIRSGNINGLRHLLHENPGLATARIQSSRGVSRTLLHVATDWPGHFPNGAATVAALIVAGADVNAECIGPHSETPLHWAASSDDMPVLDALLDSGADIEAPGAVIGGGAPLYDAVGFGQWKAARRLIERGARTALWHAAALGMMERIEELFGAERLPTSDEVNHAFWQACHGGQRFSAAFLLNRGANLNFIPEWADRAPLDAAQRAGAKDLVEWLRAKGAKSANKVC